MRRLPATLAALALAMAAGCGGDDEQGEPIPAQQAEAMLEQLDNIERQVQAGNCGSAEFQITDDGELQDKVAALPDDVDADVRTALEDGVDRLLELVEEQCGEDEEPTDTRETDTEETETQPTETETQPTETDETETQETQPPETQETQPPETQEELPLPPGDGGGAAPGAGEGGGAPSPNADAGRGSG